GTGPVRTTGRGDVVARPAAGGRGVRDRGSPADRQIHCMKTPFDVRTISSPSGPKVTSANCTRPVPRNVDASACDQVYEPLMSVRWAWVKYSSVSSVQLWPKLIGTFVSLTPTIRSTGVLGAAFVTVKAKR